MAAAPHFDLTARPRAERWWWGSLCAALWGRTRVCAAMNRSPLRVARSEVRLLSRLDHKRGPNGDLEPVSGLEAADRQIGPKRAAPKDPSDIQGHCSGTTSQDRAEGSGGCSIRSARGSAFGLGPRVRIDAIESGLYELERFPLLVC